MMNDEAGNPGFSIHRSSFIGSLIPMSITLENISKRFGGQWVVDNVSLEVADKELFVLLGSSGSGKSTILRMIAGLTEPTGGKVLLHGTDVTHLPPQQRGTGFVFQNY